MPVLCLLSLISRNSPKQLGMVSPELKPSMIEERSRAWTGAVRTGCRGMGSGASKEKGSGRAVSPRRDHGL